MRFATKVAGILLATFACIGLTGCAHKPSIHWHDSSVEALYASDLAVYVESSDDLPPVLGEQKHSSDTIRFVPAYPFQPGVTYRAVARADGRQVQSVHTYPAEHIESTTIVSQIYPSGDVVPENLLKFYLQFSAPMSGGQVYQHIHLSDESGTPVDLPFLEIDEELWNPEMTRLTLIIDPGRIKRGVKPLEDVGPALVEGKRFILKIDRAWEDARGAPLKGDFVKRFAVGGADRTSPDPSAWKITAPKSATRDPLTIDFGEPMEHALAIRLISVNQPGSTTLSDHETRWHFVPDAPWQSGEYTITIEAILEDLAGNNVGKLFDVDVRQNPRSLPVERVKRVIVIP